jgi:hypothetical protein
MSDAITLAAKYAILLEAALDADADVADEYRVGVSRLDLEVALKVRDVAKASLNAFVLDVIDNLESQ